MANEKKNFHHSSPILFEPFLYHANSQKSENLKDFWVSAHPSSGHNFDGQTIEFCENFPKFVVGQNIAIFGKSVQL